MNELELNLRRRIHSILPGLVVDQLEINQEGLVNDIVIVNQSLVFRFAKTERSSIILQTEIRILNIIRPRVSLPVPTPIYQALDCVVYPYLPGQSFLRETWLGLSDYHQERTVRQLGKFLYELHKLDFTECDWKIPVSLAPVTREKWLEIYTRVKEKVYPHLLKHQIIWAENLFVIALGNPGFFTKDLAIIHADLAPYHILFNEYSQTLCGVIDFGVAGIGDPALDIGSLLTSYGEQFVVKMQPEYPTLPGLLPRARFYAQAIELQWVLSGLETGETFWYTAHLGGARDIRF